MGSSGDTRKSCSVSGNASININVLLNLSCCFASCFSTFLVEYVHNDVTVLFYTLVSNIESIGNKPFGGVLNPWLLERIEMVMKVF